MIQQPIIQPLPSCQCDDDEPTEPRIPVQRPLVSPASFVPHMRHHKDFSVSIDEQGFVNLCVHGKDAVILRPEEAFDLFDFLYEYRNLLAARSVEVAERQDIRQNGK
jgi:hypothetical protein